MQSIHLTNNPNNDAALVHTILCFVLSTFTTDQRKARAFGVSPEQAMRMLDYTAADMMQVASRAAHCLRVQFDSDAFDGVLAEVDQKSDETSLKYACIRHEASREMMSKLFNVTHREYSFLREMLSMGPGNGRTKECHPDDAQRIHDSWQQQGGGRRAEDFLAVARELDMPLRVIWSELQGYDSCLDTPPKPLN